MDRRRSDASRVDPPVFRALQINIYSDNVPRSLAFYRSLGFTETFRTPDEGEPLDVKLKLDGFTLGIAAVSSAVADHGLAVDADAHDGARRLSCGTTTRTKRSRCSWPQAHGPLAEPHDWLGGKLRISWVADLDDNPIQLVQRRL